MRPVYVCIRPPAECGCTPATLLHLHALLHLHGDRVPFKLRYLAEALENRPRHTSDSLALRIFNVYHFSVSTTCPVLGSAFVSGSSPVTLVFSFLFFFYFLRFVFNF